jgi:hypothetical protein
MTTVNDWVDTERVVGQPAEEFCAVQSDNMGNGL